jgi:acetoin utilization deacetylase AcuC-like enzyme
MKLIDVAYSPKQISCPSTTSPSPRKPGWVISDWQKHTLAIRIVEPDPVTREQLALAHCRDYVDGVMDCRIPNGFGGRDWAVAESLRWTVGSFLTASRLALASAGVACSPTSGFHHAGFRSGYGYCTFNGLVVAARVLKNEGRVRQVGILDCDQHYGDGTAEIIKTLSIDWINHYSREYFAEYPRTGAGSKFLETLPDVVRSFSGCDLLMYQAGGDQHQDDPLGGFLTTAEMRERDRIVFAEAKALHVPVVWNLAGGYQKPHECIIEIHRHSMHACAEVHVG